MIKYHKKADRIQNLSQMQYHVTQTCGTEPPFQNQFWNNKREGIYVDIVSGEPLFSSTHKFDSGSGWPSFTRPLEKTNVVEKADHGHGMRRVEVRSKHAIRILGMYSMTARRIRVCATASIPQLCALSRRTSWRPKATANFYICLEAGNMNKERAILAGGCFWGMEELFRYQPGVLDTTVGYTGGKVPHPTYETTAAMPRQSKWCSTPPEPPTASCSNSCSRFTTRRRETGRATISVRLTARRFFI